MRLRINKDKLFGMVTIIYVFATLLVDIFRKLGNFEQGLETIRNMIYVFCFLFVIVHIFWERKLKLDIIFVLFVFPAQVFITLLITPEISPVLSFFILFYFSRSFVGYYLFSRLGNVKIFANNKGLMFIIAMGYCGMIISQGFRSDSYMASSYNLIIPTCILLIYGIKDFKIIYLLGGALSCFTILLYGARGALLCTGIGIAAFLLKYILKEKIPYKKFCLFSLVWQVCCMCQLILMRYLWDCII